MYRPGSINNAKGAEGDRVINMKVRALLTRPGQPGQAGTCQQQQQQQRSSRLEQQTSVLHHLTFQTFSFCGRRWGKHCCWAPVSAHTHSRSIQPSAQCVQAAASVCGSAVRRFAESLHRFRTKLVFSNGRSFWTRFS